MGTSFELTRLMEVWAQWGWEATIRATVLLVAIALVGMLFAKLSAALRHRLWLFGLLGFVWVPMVGVIVPEWPLLPAKNLVEWSWESAEAPISAKFRGEVDSREDRRFSNIQGTMDSDALILSRDLPRPDPTREPRSFEANPTPSIIQWAFWVWGAGAVAALTMLAIARARLSCLARRACSVDSDPTQELALQMGIRRRVRVMVTPDRTIPMTWGGWRPTLLLPKEAMEWSNARWKHIVLHELAHIRRFDCLNQTFAYLICAFYWFNPLVWWANHEMLNEAEKAADDEVLLRGGKASDYAEDLLGVTTGFERLSSFKAGVAMARSSRVSNRIKNLLYRGRCRGLTKRVAVGVEIVFIGMVVLVAAVTTEVPPAPELFGTSLETWLKQADAAPRNGDPFTGMLADAAISSFRTNAIPYLRYQLTYRPSSISRVVDFVEQTVARAMNRPSLLPDRNEHQDYGRIGFKALGRAGVPALIEVIDESHPDARQAAISCLKSIGAPAEPAVPVLHRVLEHDPRWSNRLNASGALAEIGSSPEIVDALMEGLEDPNAKVRTMSALGLGRFDKSALLKKNLNSVAEITFGTFRGTNTVKLAESSGDIHPSATQAVPLLKEVTQDADPSVRNAARFALRHIQSRHNE